MCYCEAKTIKVCCNQQPAGYLQLTIAVYCRYNVNQGNIRYSDVQQSEYATTTDYVDKKHVKPSEPEYEAIEMNSKAKTKVDCDVEMDTNPAYECVVSNPAYQATSQLASILEHKQVQL